MISGYSVAILFNNSIKKKARIDDFVIRIPALLLTAPCSYLLSSLMFFAHW